MCHKLEIRERPLLSAATECVTELFKFIENVPPFSTINLCKESREWVGGTLTMSAYVKVHFNIFLEASKECNKQASSTS